MARRTNRPNNNTIMTLSNNILTIEVSKHGAELVSLKRQGREYLWNGDARFWNRHAPILFPVVGKPYNNELHVDGRCYPMKQHGYARDSEFSRLGKGHLRMKASALSDGYPYRLGLEVQYLLKDSTVEIVWTVENRDNREAFFQIGAHPAFMLPCYDPDKLINGYVRFYDKNNELIAPAITHNLVDGNRVKRDSKILMLKETPLMPNTFIHDALILEQGQVAKVELWDRFCEPVLSVSCPQAEAFGIWAPHKDGCPFVCLEPWCGICDTVGFTDDISKRQYIHSLQPQERYTFTYTIEII